MYLQDKMVFWVATGVAPVFLYRAMASRPA